MKPDCIKKFVIEGQLYRLMYDQDKKGLDQYYIEAPENVFGYADYLYLVQTENKRYFFVRPLFRKHTEGVLSECMAVLMDAFELA